MGGDHKPTCQKKARSRVHVLSLFFDLYSPSDRVFVPLTQPSRAVKKSLPMEALEEDAPIHMTNYQIIEKLNSKQYSAESDLVRHWPNGNGMACMCCEHGST